MVLRRTEELGPPQQRRMVYPMESASVTRASNGEAVVMEGSVWFPVEMTTVDSPGGEAMVVVTYERTGITLAQWLERL